MKVKELINHLLDFDMDLDVEIPISDGRYSDSFPIYGVDKYSPYTVLLKSNSLIQKISDLEEEVSELMSIIDKQEEKC